MAVMLTLFIEHDEVLLHRPAKGTIQTPNHWVHGVGGVGRGSQIGGRRQGSQLPTHLHRVPVLRISGAIPQLLHTFRACIGTSFIGNWARIQAATNAPCHYTHTYIYTYIYIYIYIYIKLNSVALVRERTILTERPPPVGEVSANFCG